jgi:hypothetical protein
MCEDEVLVQMIEMDIWIAKFGAHMQNLWCLLDAHREVKTGSSG